MKRKARWVNSTDGTPKVSEHPTFPPGKPRAVNCACRTLDSPAKFTVTFDTYTVCSWCGGDLKGT